MHETVLTEHGHRARCLEVCGDDLGEAGQWRRSLALEDVVGHESDAETPPQIRSRSSIATALRWGALSLR